MRKQWKRLAAILGAAVLVVSQSSFVLAEEEKLPVQETQEESLQQEKEADGGKVDESETEAVEEVNPADNLVWVGTTGIGSFKNPNDSTVWWYAELYKEEDSGYKGTYYKNMKLTAIDAGDTDEIEFYHLFNGSGTYYFTVTFVNEDGSEIYGVSAPSPVYVYEEPELNIGDLQPATDLEWNERGQGLFYNPNKEAAFRVYMYYGSNHEEIVTRGSRFSSGTHSEGWVCYDLYHLIESYGKDGEYWFAVEAMLSEDVRVMSALSGSFSYTKPNVQLPAPKITVSRSGFVSCEIPGVDEYVLGDDYGVNYTVWENGSQIFQQGTNETKYDLSKVVKEGHRYTIKVQTLSRRFDKLLSSEWSEYTLDLRAEDGSSSEEDSFVAYANADSSSSTDGSSAVGQESVVEVWKPSTPDEVKRYEAYGREQVNFTTGEKNDYSVTIHNAMQGKLCFDSFEAVLGDYTIGRTYNIYPSGGMVYKADSKARITLNIPAAIQKVNRDFRMICVTEKGQPVVLADLDSDPGTITFETDTYYAFALVYKDAK